MTLPVQSLFAEALRIYTHGLRNHIRSEEKDVIPLARETLVAEDWAEIDRSHRKLAHRGSRLGAFYASESSVLRVLTAEGVHLPERPPRERGAKRAWPEWAELVPGVIWIYDFTHFRASKRCAVAVLDVVSRYWLATVVSAEESSTQVEVAFTRALVADGKEHLLDEEQTDRALRSVSYQMHAAHPGNVACWSPGGRGD